MSGPRQEHGGGMSREDALRLFAASEFHRAMGLELAAWEHGRVTLRFTPPEAARGPGTGAIHGGAVTTALDVAACFAVISVVGQDCFTVDLRADFLRPAVGTELVATGTVLRVGRRLGRADAVLAGSDATVFATARGTFTW